MHRRDLLTGSAALAAYAALPDAAKAMTAQQRAVLFGVAPKKNNFIFDSDMSTDPASLTALGVAISLHKKGVINLIGAATCGSNVYGAPCVKAICAVNGVSPLIGAYQGSATSASSPYVQQIAARFWNASDTRVNYPSAVSVYRTLLAQSPNNSAIISINGYLTNAAALLQSSADAISPLNGIQLVAKKVKYFVVMGGDYPSSASPEYNFAGDAASAAYFFNNCPQSIPLYGTGYTLGLSTSVAPPSLNPLVSPIEYGYNLAGYDSRPAWDETSIYFGATKDIPGLRNNFAIVGANGTNTVDPSTGANVWTSTPGNVSYIGFINLMPATQQIGIVSPTYTPWTLRRTVPTLKAALSPLGTMTASKLDETAVTDFFDIFLGVTVLPSTTYTLSASFKPAQRAWARIGAVGNSGVWYNLSGASGSLGTTQGNVAAIAADANGFYRCSITVTTTGTVLNHDIALAPADAIGTYAGIAGDGIYAWGAQIVKGNDVPYIQDVSTTFAELLANIL